METPTDHLLEIWTAIAASGAECILSFSPTPMYECHPFVPVIQIGPDGDVDLEKSSGDAGSAALEIVRAIVRAGDLDLIGNQRAAFQVTRGLLGVSL